MDSEIESNDTAEASSMLEAALKQMDGILISPCNLNSDISKTNVLSTAKTLSLALTQVGLQLAPNPEIDSSQIIYEWLEPHFQPHDEISLLYKNKLQVLSKKYRTLTDTAKIQSTKIFDLEKQITDKILTLNSYQDQLQKVEILNSSLENQKLSVLSTLSELRLQIATLEQENIELKNNVNITRSIEKLYITTGSGEQINETLTAPKTPPASFRYQLNSQFHSLPRQSLCNSTKLSSFPQSKNEKVNKNVAFADESTNVSIIRPTLFPEKVKGECLCRIFQNHLYSGSKLVLIFLISQALETNG